MLKKTNQYLKSHRLLTKNDFQNLRVGNRFFVSGVLLYYYKENELDHSRLGIAISKKIGSAVKRNKLKRKIRELFRSSSLKLDNYDIVVALNFKNIKSKKLSFDDVLNNLNQSFVDKLPN